MWWFPGKFWGYNELLFLCFLSRLVDIYSQWTLDIVVFLKGVSHIVYVFRFDWSMTQIYLFIYFLNTKNDTEVTSAVNLRCLWYKMWILDIDNFVNWLVWRSLWVFWYNMWINVSSNTRPDELSATFSLSKKLTKGKMLETPALQAC